MKHGSERFASQQRFMKLVAAEQDRAEARDDLEWAHTIGRAASQFLDALYRFGAVEGVEELAGGLDADEAAGFIPEIETVSPQGGVL